MPLARRFISAHIREQAKSWVVTIRYSYYSIYEFEETEVVETLQQAKDFLLLQRVPGLQIIDKDNNPVKVL